MANEAAVMMEVIKNSKDTVFSRLILYKKCSTLNQLNLGPLNLRIPSTRTGIFPYSQRKRAQIGNKFMDSN
jgi:hypothetical protein